MASPGDWSCPNENCINHVKLVFANKEICPKCGASKFGDGNDGVGSMKGLQGGDMPDDWQCPNEACINHTKLVFGKKTSCPVCGTARNARQAGDWSCPNLVCQNHKNTVFGSKASCPKCGCPRPSFGRPAAPRAQMVPMGPMMPMSNHFGYANPPPVVHRVVHQAPQMMPTSNPDDWMCPNVTCMNHTKGVFARHSSCPKCGVPKPMVTCFGGGGVAMMGKGGNFMGGGCAGIHNRPDDWQCPNAECINNRKLVFAKHVTCPQCGAEKPRGMVPGGVMPRNAREGDWQCPSEDCMNHRKMVFGKNDNCPQCGASKPQPRTDRSRSPVPRMGAGAWLQAP